MPRKAVAGQASTIESPAGEGPFEGGIQELVRESSSLRQLVIQARERGVVTIEEIKSALA